MYIYTFNKYLLNKFNKRLWRIPLSTGFPCPNRIDGNNGCSFCNGTSFLPRYLKDNDSLKNQIVRGINFFSQRYKVSDFYGYFQYNTSTYGPVDELIEKYETVLSLNNMKGLIISTRPDYIFKELINRILDLNKKYNKDIWIELGLQSVYNKTLKRINRNHTYEDFIKAVKIIKKNSDFKISVHNIIGLPEESPEMIEDGLKRLFEENEIDGIKFRLLEIIRGTSIYDEYINNPNDFFKFDFHSYCSLLCNILEKIPENIVIMRLVNFKSLEYLTKTNDKKISKLEVLNYINDLFKSRGTKQGFLCNKK